MSQQSWTFKWWTGWTVLSGHASNGNKESRALRRSYDGRLLSNIEAWFSWQKTFSETKETEIYVKWYCLIKIMFKVLMFYIFLPWYEVFITFFTVHENPWKLRLLKISSRQIRWNYGILRGASYVWNTVSMF